MNKSFFWWAGRSWRVLSQTLRSSGTVPTAAGNAPRLRTRLAAALSRLLAPASRRAPGASAPPPSPPEPVPLPVGRCVSVVIPALNEAEHIAGVVAFARADVLTAEVIVIDDSSTDDTVLLAERAGARVVTSTLLGKGASMQDGVRVAKHEILVYLDGDLSGLREGLISDLCQPILADSADFVKARFSRGGGRVTELTAKPMLKVFFPELAHLAQPLGGIIAARRGLLQQLSFEDGYGVDIGLVIDAHRNGARLAEVDIGSLQHDSQPLHDLTAMANEVSRVIYNRARTAGRLHVDQIVSMLEAQRQAAASLEHVLSRWRGQLRLLLLDADALLAGAPLMQQLAFRCGVAADGPEHSGEESLDHIQQQARKFRFVNRQAMEQAARELPLKAGVVEFVNRMRRSGFMVGVLSDGWFLAAEVLRRRVFADFSLAHTLLFEGEVCNGEVRINPAWLAPAGTWACKSHVLRHLREPGAGLMLFDCWAVGSRAADLPLLRLADTAFAFHPLAADVQGDSTLRAIHSFADLLEMVPGPRPREPAPKTEATAQASV